MKTKVPSSACRARMVERQKLLDGILQKIVEQEEGFGVFDLHRIFSTELSDIPWSVRFRVLKLFKEVSKEIKHFQRTPEEGNALFATLFEWAARRIGRPYHAALQKQEQFRLELVPNANKISK